LIFCSKLLVFLYDNYIIVLRTHNHFNVKLLLKFGRFIGLGLYDLIIYSVTFDWKLAKIKICFQRRRETSRRLEGSVPNYLENVYLRVKILTFGIFLIYKSLKEDKTIKGEKINGKFSIYIYLKCFNVKLLSKRFPSLFAGVNRNYQKPIF
jgi:hypothetical protein